MDSCHHRPWLSSIPKSQFMRLRRNCSDPHVFRAQAKILTDRFLEKGYSIESLLSVLNEVENMNRDSLLQDKLPQANPNSHPSSNIGVPFVTTYSLQHRSIKKIISKHWHIINSDNVLKDILPNRPQVVFRGAPSLRNRIIPNILDPPVKKLTFFDQLKGFYQCKKCRVCSYNTCTHRGTRSFVSTSTQI